MKTFVKCILAMALAVLCQYGHATENGTGEGPVAKILKTGKKTKILEGPALKVARPILKKTPVSVIIDKISMMLICPLDPDRKDMQELADKAEKALGKYVMVREIDDELSHIFTYVDNTDKGRFSELILYNKRPETYIMIFEGDFTIEDLIRVGELSVQDRKDRISARYKNN